MPFAITEVSPGVWKDNHNTLVEVDRKEKFDPKIYNLLESLSPVVDIKQVDEYIRVVSENGHVSYFNPEMFEWFSDLAGTKLFLSREVIRKNCILFSISGNIHIAVCPIVNQDDLAI